MVKFSIHLNRRVSVMEVDDPMRTEHVLESVSELRARFRARFRARKTGLSHPVFFFFFCFVLFY